MGRDEASEESSVLRVSTRHDGPRFVRTRKGPGADDQLDGHDAGVDHAQPLGRGVGDVDNPPLVARLVRTAVVDREIHLAIVRQVADAYAGPERQVVVRGRQLVLVEALAVSFP